MEKQKLIKCSECGGKFGAEGMIEQTKRKKLCQACFERIRKEKQDYDALIKYIKQELKQPLEGRTGKAIKKCREEYGYSFEDIQYILYYIYRVLNKSIQGYCMDLVPYYYSQARKHAETVERSKQSMVNYVPPEIRVVYRDKKSEPKLNNTRLIDISELEM